MRYNTAFTHPSLDAFLYIFSVLKKLFINYLRGNKHITLHVISYFTVSFSLSLIDGRIRTCQQAGCHYHLLLVSSSLVRRPSVFISSKRKAQNSPFVHFENHSIRPILLTMNWNSPNIFNYKFAACFLILVSCKL